MDDMAPSWWLSAKSMNAKHLHLLSASGFSSTKILDDFILSKILSLNKDQLRTYITDFNLLCVRRLRWPVWRDGEALVAGMVEPDHLASEHRSHILHPAQQFHKILHTF